MKPITAVSSAVMGFLFLNLTYCKMNSFIFSNVRSFLVSILVGVASFFIFTSIFLNQITGIFNTSIETAFLIFGLVYVVIPIAFLIGWFITYTENSFRLFSTRELTIMVLLMGVFLLVSIILLSFPVVLPSITALIATGLFAAVIVIYSLRLWNIEPTLEGVRKNRIEFFISYGSIAIIILWFFGTNFSRMEDTSKKSIDKVFQGYASAKKSEAVEGRIRDVISNLGIASGSGVIYNQADKSIDHNVAAAIFFTAQLQTNEPLWAKLNDYNNSFNLLAKYSAGSTFDVSGYTQIDNLLDQLTNDLPALESEILLKFGSGNNQALLSKLSTLMTTYADKMKLVSQKIKKQAEEKWTVLLNILKYKILIIFSVLLLFMLCLHFHFAIANEKAKSEFKERQQSISKSGDNEYVITDKKTYKEFPEIQILTSGISLIVLLIIPIFRPIDKKQVNLDKPFITFNLMHLFNTNDSDHTSITTISHNYYIDSLTVKTGSEGGTVKIDFKDFEKQFKTSSLYWNDTLKDIIISGNNAQTNIAKLNQNLKVMSFAFGTNAPGGRNTGAALFTPFIHQAPNPSNFQDITVKQ